MARWVYLLAVPLALAQVAAPILAQEPSQAQQPTAAQPAAPAYTQAQLEQMLAPIALYPDDLLTQVLVASTYPLEVVMASRWLEQPGNKDLKGDALLKALDAEDWDASVKSLIPFPTVLKTMSDQLDWTQKLGDAFLAQQADVFAAVQALRARAQSAGTLQSNAQQTVTREASAIVIQPAQPDVVYVPAYNPTVVYGAWPYPAYPPVYYPPPPGAYLGPALATGLAFGAGVAITGALWGWGRPNWNSGNVYVNANRFNSINANRYNNFRSTAGAVNSNVWQHNAAHRRGVAYSNNQVRQQYRPNAGASAASRDAFRGRNPSAGTGLAGAGPRPGGANPPNLQRPNAGGQAPARAQNIQRPNAGGQAPARGQNIQRPNAGGQAPARAQNIQRPNAGGQAPARAQNIQRPAGGGGNFQGRTQAARAGGSGAFQGVGNGAATRAQSAQGRASRSGMPRGGGGGGFGGRAGGGGHGGGHRGGRR